MINSRNLIYTNILDLTRQQTWSITAGLVPKYSRLAGEVIGHSIKKLEIS